MDIGMLSPMKRGTPWFDNDKKTDLAAKVGRAAAYYQKKYGQMPNLCFVNPASINGNGSPRLTESPVSLGIGGGDTACRGVEIRTSKTIIPNHFWIGVNSI